MSPRNLAYWKSPILYHAVLCGFFGALCDLDHLSMNQELPTFIKENKSKILRNLGFLVVLVIAYSLFDAFLADQNEKEVKESEKQIQELRDDLKKQEAEYKKNQERRRLLYGN